jgi:hypothetical protein
VHNVCFHRFQQLPLVVWSLDRSDEGVKYEDERERLQELVVLVTCYILFPSEMGRCGDVYYMLLLSGSIGLRMCSLQRCDSFIFSSKVAVSHSDMSCNE